MSCNGCKQVNPKTGIFVDIVDTAMPVLAPIGVVEDIHRYVPNCNNHQAPHGYHYVYQNGHCILTRRGGKPVVFQNITGVVPAVINQTPLSGLQGLMSWAQLNRGLALAIVGVGFYLATKNK